MTTEKKVEAPKELTARERGQAAWESAVARNLNPSLNQEQSSKLWKAVIDQRERPDAGRFEKDAIAAIGNVGNRGPVIAACVANLREVLAIKEG